MQEFHYVDVFVFVFCYKDAGMNSICSFELTVNALTKKGKKSSICDSCMPVINPSNHFSIPTVHAYIQYVAKAITELGDKNDRMIEF